MIALTLSSAVSGGRFERALAVPLHSFTFHPISNPPSTVSYPLASAVLTDEGGESAVIVLGYLIAPALDTFGHSSPHFGFHFDLSFAISFSMSFDSSGSKDLPVLVLISFS